MEANPDFFPDDVRGLHAGCKAKGVSVTELRVAALGMLEFEIRDSDDHWLWFGESTDDLSTVTE